MPGAFSEPVRKSLTFSKLISPLLHFCTRYEPRRQSEAASVQKVERVWHHPPNSLFFPTLVSLLFVLPCFSLVCHSYKHLLITTDGGGRPVCKGRRQQEQRGALNKTPPAGPSNGEAVCSREAVEREATQDRSSLSPSLMGSCMPGKWACPGWPGSSSSAATEMITLIILFSSWSTRQHNPCFSSAPLPRFYFSPGILRHLVLSVAVKLGGADGIKGACPAVDQGRNPAGGWAACLQNNMAGGEGSAQGGWDRRHYWVESCTICGFLFLALCE